MSQNCVLLVEKRKSEYQISLDTKCQLKLTILSFWSKFAQKEYFRSKTEKVNNTIKFCVFELF